MKPFKIETIHAFIATDSDGVEGIPAFEHNGMMMPLVCANLDRVKSLRPMAAMMAKASGQKFKLAKFSVREDMEAVG